MTKHLVHLVISFIYLQCIITYNQYLHNHNGYGHNGFEGCDSHAEASGWCSGMVIDPCSAQNIQHFSFIYIFKSTISKNLIFKIMKVQMVLYLLLFPRQNETWFEAVFS